MRLLLLLLLIALCATAQAREDTVQLPFGLQWETYGRELEAGLTKAQAKIVEKRRTIDGEVWTVEGLPQPALQRAIFTLKEDLLTEVELQYGAADWDIWTFDEFMHRVRSGLEMRYGAGQQLARKREANAEVRQTLVGYNWRVAGKMLELVYFAAQDEKNAMRLISLHYRTGGDKPKAAGAQGH